MKIDQCEFLDAVEALNGCPAEGLTGEIKSVIHNPVPPSEFDLFAPTQFHKRKWEFAKSHPYPFPGVSDYE